MRARHEDRETSIVRGINSISSRATDRRSLRARGQDRVDDNRSIARHPDPEAAALRCAFGASGASIGRRRIDRRDRSCRCQSSGGDQESSGALALPVVRDGSFGG
jgi:hypothetical protein